MQPNISLTCKKYSGNKRNRERNNIEDAKFYLIKTNLSE